MFNTSYQKRFKGILRSISAAVLVTFLTTSIVPPQRAYAQELNLPAVGTMLKLTNQFMPATVKGIKIDTKNPLNFIFLIDPGQTPMSDVQKREEYRQLVKYFLAALTTPEKDMWVNLSPYEKNRVISEDFGQTEMGRDMLGQDYLLKQLTASLVYPEESLGKEFWQKVYSRVQSEFGGAQVPVNTFNKVWIVPSSATVYEKGNVGMVVKSRLKVLMEEDYLAMDRNVNAAKMGISNLDNYKAVHSASSQVMKEVIIPEIEREVNEGANFAQLRQMYNSMILASWFKGTLKNHILNKVYANKNKSAGVELENPEDNNRIFQQYVQAFKKGVYNYIKEETDPVSGTTVPRKYFSGGFNFEGTEAGVPGSVLARTSILPDAQMQGEVKAELDEALVTLDESSGQIDVAMVTDSFDERKRDYQWIETEDRKYFYAEYNHQGEILRIYISKNGRTVEVNSLNLGFNVWDRIVDQGLERNIIRTVNNWPVERKSGWSLATKAVIGVLLLGLIWFPWNKLNTPSSTPTSPQAAPITNAAPAKAVPAQAAQTNVWAWSKHPVRTNAFYATNPGFPGVIVFRDEKQQLSLQTSTNGAWQSFGTNTFALNQALTPIALKAAEDPKKSAATNVASEKPISATNPPKVQLKGWSWKFSDSDWEFVNPDFPEIWGAYSLKVGHYIYERRGPRAGDFSIDTNELNATEFLERIRSGEKYVLKQRAAGINNSVSAVASAKPAQQSAGRMITQTNWIKSGNSYRAFNPNNRSQILIYNPKTGEFRGATWSTNRNNWSGPMSAEDLAKLRAKVQQLPNGQAAPATKAPAVKKDDAMTVDILSNRDKEGITLIQLIASVAVAGLVGLGLYKYYSSSNGEKVQTPVANVSGTNAISAPALPELIPAPPMAALSTNAAAKPKLVAKSKVNINTNLVTRTNAPGVKKPAITLPTAVTLVNPIPNPTTPQKPLNVWIEQKLNYAYYISQNEALSVDKQTGKVARRYKNASGQWVEDGASDKFKALEGQVKTRPKTSATAQPATGSKTNAAVSAKNELPLKIVRVHEDPFVIAKPKDIPGSSIVTTPSTQAPSAALNNVWQAIKDVFYADNKKARVAATTKLGDLMTTKSSELDPESRRIAEDFLKAAKESSGNNTSRMRNEAEEMRQLLNKRIEDAAKRHAAYGGIDFDDQYLQKNIIGEGIDVQVLQGFDWLLTQPITGFTPRVVDIQSGFGFTLSFFNGIITPQLRLAAAQNIFGTSQAIDIADHRYGREVLAKI